MAISNFDGNTFVAFTDISGFKELMKQNNKAWEALDVLYTHGYRTLSEHNENNRIKVEGIFISDCGVLFVRNDEVINNKTDELIQLLKVLRVINQRMIDNDFMLTTSIAYGQFKYQERIEFQGIEKNTVYGGAYVSAFFDNENGTPRIQPGQCRVVKKDLPTEVNQFFQDGRCDINNELSVIRAKDKDDKHYYFYWNVQHSDEIDEFEKRYNDSYNLKFSGMLKALRCFRNY
jgi:hypothetical protein